MKEWIHYALNVCDTEWWKNEEDWGTVGGSVGHFRRSNATWSVCSLLCFHLDGSWFPQHRICISSIPYVDEVLYHYSLLQHNNALKRNKNKYEFSSINIPTDCSQSQQIITDWSQVDLFVWFSHPSSMSVVAHHSSMCWQLGLCSSDVALSNSQQVPGTKNVHCRGHYGSRWIHFDGWWHNFFHLPN